MQSNIDNLRANILNQIYIARNMSKDSKQVDFLLQINDTLQRALGKDLSIDEIDFICNSISKLIET